MAGLMCFELEGERQGQHHYCSVALPVWGDVAGSLISGLPVSVDA